MSKNPVITEIVEGYKPIWALDHVSALLEWDMETYMPLGASKGRGFAQAQNALMKQKAMTDLSPLVTKAEKLSGLDDYDRGVVRVMKRDIDYYMKIPPKLLAR